MCYYIIVKRKETKIKKRRIKQWKKAEQREINEKVERAVKWYNEKIRHSDNMILVGRLRKCNAVIYATPDYIILKSYDNIVAFIDKYEMGLYDFSRLVYGYTATTTQYIAKTDTPGRRWDSMKMIIDGLTIEGSEVDFETLRIKLHTISRAYEELAKVYKSLTLTDLSVEYMHKSLYIAEVLARRSGNEE